MEQVTPIQWGCPDCQCTDLYQSVQVLAWAPVWEFDSLGNPIDHGEPEKEYAELMGTFQCCDCDNEFTKPVIIEPEEPEDEFIDLSDCEDMFD